MDPEHILNNPLLNKGTAFTEKERDELHLHGFLPYHISTIEEQVERRYQNFKDKRSALAKFSFLSALQNRNEVLFYRLVHEHIAEMLPLIYTPTVGDVSVHYSMLYTQHRGIYLSYPLKDRIEEIIQNIPQKDVDVIVVTDGERILGLGDLGVGGMAIPVGKLALYTLFGAIHPGRTLPIVLDVGTNNQTLLDDPLYLGWKHERVRGKPYQEFVDIFVKAIKKRYPNVLLQWEDFGRENAKPLLDRYRDAICSFNDDIQGTASVVLAAAYVAASLTKSKLNEQRIILFGGGSAGIGIARQLLGAMLEEKIPLETAKKAFYVIDIHGMVHTGLDGLSEEHKFFARSKEEIGGWKVKDRSNITLLEAVQNLHPHILIGVSTQGGAFTEEIVTTMAKYVDRPVIFPLSNPTAKSEAHPADLIHWTKGKAIIATGSPFDAVDYNDTIYTMAQCNNVYIFPGVGLGVIACKAKKVSDRMFFVAAQTLSREAPILHHPQGSLFPPFEKLREISKKIACAVVAIAQEEGLSPKTSSQQIEAMVDKAMWFPHYSD
jgi:malate dehydrogenase (oxaloacetate-decarboxylating)